MNEVIFFILFIFLICNFLAYPIYTLYDYVWNVFICRGKPQESLEFWQAFKWKRFRYSWEQGIADRSVEWFMCDGLGGVAALFVLAMLGAFGLLWAPVLGISLGFGARYLMDNFNE